MKVAIYARVSTNEQNVQNQVVELERYCTARAYEVYKMYVDEGVSGSKESRPQFDAMMSAASKRLFDCLLVWKLDRLSRSLKHLLNTMDTLNSLGISFICYTDNIDTTTSTGKLMFSIIGAFSEFERSLIRERVCLGLQRAREKGKKLGRPIAKLNDYKVSSLSYQGMSLREIARQTGVCHVTVLNHLARHKSEIND